MESLLKEQTESKKPQSEELSEDALDQAAGGLLPGEVSYRPYTPVPHDHSEY